MKINKQSYKNKENKKDDIRSSGLKVQIRLTDSTEKVVDEMRSHFKQLICLYICAVSCYKKNEFEELNKLLIIVLVKWISAVYLSGSYQGAEIVNDLQHLSFELMWQTSCLLFTNLLWCHKSSLIFEITLPVQNKHPHSGAQPAPIGFPSQSLNILSRDTL